MKIFKPNDWVMLKIFAFVLLLIICMISLCLFATNDFWKHLKELGITNIPTDLIVYFTLIICSIAGMMGFIVNLKKK